MRFEEHEGELFRMLEEPVPLTDDTELPVLVRMIQDDTMLGKANKRSYHPDTLAQKIICSSSKLTDDGLFMDGNYTYCYEIIGAFVEEGSEDWAWHMMQEGYKTKHCESTSQRFYAIRKGNNYCAFYDNEWKEVDINTRRTYCEFIEYAKAFPGYGWRILKEHEQPKPEPIFTTGDKVTDGVIEGTIIHIEDAIADVCPSTDEYKIELRNLNHIPESPKKDDVEKPKPLLAEAKVGDLCQRRDGKWVQVDSYSNDRPCPVMCKSDIGGQDCFTLDGRNHNAVNNDKDIIHTEPLAPEGTAEWALQMMKLGEKVRNRDWDGGLHEKSLLYCQLIGETIKHNEGCSALDVCLSDWEAPYIKNTGWQIYKEQKPQYKVGDWVEHKESKEQATIRRIMSYGAIEIEFAYSTESDIYQANDFHNDFRKLSPSEVIVKIGCLSGTIAKSCDPNYFLMWHSRPMTDCNYSIIRFSAIDKETREFVEGLLEAQEDK